MTSDPSGPRRVHRRKGAPSAATRSLLADYQGAMRDELRGLLADLAPKAPAGQLDIMGQPLPARRHPLGERSKMWDLAIRLGRELGAELDQAPAAEDGAPAAGPLVGRPRARSRVDWG